MQAIAALRDAIESRDLGSIQRALNKANAGGVDPNDSTITEANALVTRLQKEAETLKSLVGATARKDKASLDQALASAAALDLSASAYSEVADAEACREMLSAQETCRAALSQVR